MADEYPRLLTDRDVVVVRDGEPEQTGMRAWPDGWDGPMPTYRIELVTHLGTTPARIPPRDRTCSRPWSGSAASSNRTA